MRIPLSGKTQNCQHYIGAGRDAVVHESGDMESRIIFVAVVFVRFLPDYRHAAADNREQL